MGHHDLRNDHVESQDVSEPAGRTTRSVLTRTVVVGCIARQAGKRAGRESAIRQRIHQAKAAKKAKPKPQPTAPAPFASTGCTSGSWPFQAQMTFNDHTTQTASATVACKAG
jgi:hypothetical protein